MRGSLRKRRRAVSPPHPLALARKCAAELATSPRTRGEVKKKASHPSPSRIGGAYDSAVSQGKWIQVSCDTSVM